MPFVKFLYAIQKGTVQTGKVDMYATRANDNIELDMATLMLSDINQNRKRRQLEPISVNDIHVTITHVCHANPSDVEIINREYYYYKNLQADGEPADYDYYYNMVDWSAWLNGIQLY